MAGGIVSTEPLINNVAIVDASRAMNMPSNIQSIAASSTTLALAATIIATASFTDRIGRRRGLFLGLLLVIIGDLIAAAAIQSWIFIVARLITGVGCGAILATSLSLLRSISPDMRQFGKAVGIWTAYMYVAATIFGFVGGILNGIDWRLAYCTIPIFATILLLLGRVFLPSPAPVRMGKYDVLGVSTLGLGMVGVLFGLGNAAGQPGSPLTWIAIAVGIVFFVVFYFVERGKEHPAFPVFMFKDPIFMGALIAGMLWNAAEAVVLYQSSLMWQYVYVYTPFKTLLGQAPVTVGAICAALVVGTLLARGSRPRYVIFVGSCVLAVGFLICTFAQVDSPYLLFLPAVLLIGIGVTAVATPQAQVFVARAPEKFLGPVSAARAGSGQLGYTLGIAGSAVIMSSLVQANFKNALNAAGVPVDEWGGYLSMASKLLFHGDDAQDSLSQIVLERAKEQYLAGFRVMSAIIAVTCVVVGLIVVFLMRKEPDVSEEVVEAEAEGAAY